MAKFNIYSYSANNGDNYQPQPEISMQPNASK